jgi:hypothetical protein
MITIKGKERDMIHSKNVLRQGIDFDVTSSEFVKTPARQAGADEAKSRFGTPCPAAGQHLLPRR